LCGSHFEQTSRTAPCRNVDRFVDSWTTVPSRLDNIVQGRATSRARLQVREVSRAGPRVESHSAGRFGQAWPLNGRGGLPSPACVWASLRICAAMLGGRRPDEDGVADHGDRGRASGGKTEVRAGRQNQSVRKTQTASRTAPKFVVAANTGRQRWLRGPEHSAAPLTARPASATNCDAGGDAIEFRSGASPGGDVHRVAWM